MKLTKEEFWKINDVEHACIVVKSLSRLLYENYESVNENSYNDSFILIEILFEKIKIMENKLNDLTSCLIKQ